jgi:hypothetical protein
MKKKGNRQVPNCVPVAEVTSGPEITSKDLLFKAAAQAMQAASQEGISLDYEQAIKQASKLYGIPYTPSELPRLLSQRAEIDRQLTVLKQGKQVAKARRKEKLAPTPAGAEEYWKSHALPTDRIKPPAKSLEEQLEEDLKKWFKEKWVRFGPDGKIRGDCARGDDSEGKPKCLPQSKAHSLGKKGRAAAASKKRREDPDPERRGPAKNVATKVQENRGGNYEELSLRKSSADKFAVLDRTLDAVIMTTNDLKAAKQEAIEWADYDDISTEIVDQTTGKKIFAVDGYAGAMKYLDEKQDACYSKVKSRYKVWPSAYASGALVQCRKKGAANWGNKGSKKK